MAKTTKLLTLIMLVSLTSTSFAAEDLWADFSENLSGSLGAGVLISEKPYTGVDTETYVIPFARITYKQWFFEGTRLGYNLYGNENWQFAPILQWRFDNYESSDSSALSGMADRDMTLDGGFKLSNRNDLGNLTFSWVTDLLSEHQGSEFEINFSKRYPKAFEIKKLSIIPSLGVSFETGELTDYYYGVRTSEASGPTRPAYKADGSINYTAGVNFVYNYSDKWDLTAGFNYTWFDDEIKNSPIVSQDGVYTIIAGAAYKF